MKNKADFLNSPDYLRVLDDDEEFRGMMKPKLLQKAREIVASNCPIAYKVDRGRLYLKIDNVECSIAIDAEHPLQSFRCNCSCKDIGFCEHFPILASIIFCPSIMESIYYDSGYGVSYMERQALKSRLVPKEFKETLKVFEKDFTKADQRDDARTHHLLEKTYRDLYEIRNNALHTYIDLIQQAIKQNDLKVALSIANYGFFKFVDVVGLEDERMMTAVYLRVREAWYNIASKKSLGGEKLVWDYLKKSLLGTEIYDLPDCDILEKILNFMENEFDDDSFLDKKLSLLDELADRCLEAGEEITLEHIILPYLRLLGRSNVDDEAYYEECRSWWDLPGADLAYLEFCMSRNNYLAAKILAEECLEDLEIDKKIHMERLMYLPDIDDEFDEEKELTLHEILLRCYFKLDKESKMKEECEFLAYNYPYDLATRISDYLHGDANRWEKYKNILEPMIDKARSMI
ncbi:hypothetical protein IJ135_00505 [Candidatus Saccharibacteria bacterium]|nr:hypothetical protein [Candidatus Saccharibacteria bacterium]